MTPSTRILKILAESTARADAATYTHCPSGLILCRDRALAKAVEALESMTEHARPAAQEALAAILEILEPKAP